MFLLLFEYKVHLLYGPTSSVIYMLFVFLDRFRLWCHDMTNKAWFDFIVLVFIAANCITLAMERPNIPPWSLERYILDMLNHVFTFVFTIEMFFKVGKPLLSTVCTASCDHIVNTQINIKNEKTIPN